MLWNCSKMHRRVASHKQTENTHLTWRTTKLCKMMIIWSFAYMFISYCSGYGKNISGTIPILVKHCDGTDSFWQVYGTIIFYHLQQIMNTIISPIRNRTYLEEQFLDLTGGFIGLLILLFIEEEEELKFCIFSTNYIRFVAILISWIYTADDNMGGR